MNDPQKNAAAKPRAADNDSPDGLSTEQLLDQIVEEFTAGLRGGRHPSIDDYQRRYPDLSEPIEQLLTSVAMIEQLKLDSDQSDDRFNQLEHLSDLDRIDGYRIVREVGRGGMGVVFEAVHETLGRQVAIKVLPTPLVGGEKHVARFRQEARSAAKLHHTNIVSVFGVGESDGLCYYVMDFVDGLPISAVINGLCDNKTPLNTPVVANTHIDTAAEGVDLPVSSSNDDLLLVVPSAGGESASAELTVAPPPVGSEAYFRWTAKMTASIADALAYAHSANILHRDIKPSNLVLDRQGVVWITDFGLAKDSTAESNLTATGAVLGTPQYLAPESLEGQYDQRSEIYCLGLTLYELATLKPAFAAGTPAEVIRSVATQAVAKPRSIDRRIPIDLSTIIEKAISSAPGHRYADAAALRDDLLAFSNDHPISARRPPMLETAVRWSRRNPLTAALLGVSGLLLMLVAVIASTGYVITTDALRKEAEKTTRLEQQQLKTEAARQQAVENFDQMKKQFDRAEANVTTTVRAFDEMFKRVISRGANRSDVEIDGLREISGIASSVTAEDAAFLDKMATFYQEFATNNADNAALRSESAKAFRRVGNIYHRVGEMAPAIEAYRKALNLYQQIYDDPPGSKPGLLTIARIQLELSSASLKNGDAIEAGRWNERSIRLLESSPAIQSDPEIRLQLARTLTNMGLTMYRIGGLSAAPRRGAGRANENNRGRRPGFRGSKKNSASPTGRPGSSSNQRINDFVRSGGGWQRLRKQNKERINRAIQIIDELVAQAPDNPDYQSVQATYLFIAAAARIREDRDGGLALRDRSIGNLESLVDQYPDNVEYEYLLALACALTDSPPHPGDIQSFSRSLEITGQLLERFPVNLDYHHLNASLLTKKAAYLLRNDRLDEALKNLSQAVDSIRTLHELTPSDRSYQPTKAALNSTIQKLATAFKAADQNEQARTAAALAKEVRLNLRLQRPSRRPAFNAP